MPEMLKADPDSEAQFHRWIAAFRTSALDQGISPRTYDREMALALLLPDVIARDQNQAEFTKTTWHYLDIAVSDDRISKGRAALSRHADLLKAIEARYAVPKEIVTAIWGLETSFGTQRGDIDTISALATLAFEGRRAPYFSAELLVALRILDEGHITRAEMLGSWAGAMGHSQFMPSSWAKFAVDYDGDGKRNIWSDDPTDALASTAHYLAEWGWQEDMPWGLEVSLPQGFDYAKSSAKITKDIQDWQEAGLRTPDLGALPGQGPASVLLPAGARGPAFLIRPNFHVLEKYNFAEAYVIGIGHLSDRLRGGADFHADWPRDWRALTLDERKELQSLLTDMGHLPPGGIDGRIGPRSIAALSSWQKSKGLVADGYPSPDVLIALRQASATD